MTEFTPWTGLAGGMLIGLSAVLLLWSNGRIAGISGVVGGLLGRPSGDSVWRLAFIGGLFAGALSYLLVTGDLGVSTTTPGPWMLLAGFIVGFGTRLGSGCTSGHGVCGIGRLSTRSLVATATFMLVAALTVYVVRHVIGGLA